MIWRRTEQTSNLTVVDEEPISGESGTESNPPSKGRPTPKRREAEQARKEALKGPSDRKSVRKAERERMRQDRARARQAMLDGDPKALPARDQGPVKQFVRDFVDSRRSLGEIFVPAAIIVLVLGMTPSPEIRATVMMLWMVLLVVAVIENLVLVLRLRKAVGSRWPEPESRKGIAFYSIMRNLQIRKLRIPPPRVGPGGKPVKPKKPRS